MTGLELSFRHRRGTFGLDVTQTLPASGLTAVFGPSGAGKSSLLRAIAGFDRTCGRISLNGDVWEDGRFFLPPAPAAGWLCVSGPPAFCPSGCGGKSALCGAAW